MSTAIRIENLGKKYMLNQSGKNQGYTALRDVLAEGAKTLAKGIISPKTLINSTKKEEFWALKDINLEIEQGDKIALIGHNGAGKSTLLKTLSRITEPTTGKIELYGRVASLLEVGTGFHPELSGRENIFLNGSILGMTHTEIRRKFDEIVDFAGVERFLDTPVKRYSSGMRMRLGFAVAAHLESEILIIDEVLAVGDAAFQKKCLGKMDEVSKSEGRTIIFVSHNMGAVQQLCNKGVLLQKGQVKFTGNLTDTIERYGQSYMQEESSSWTAGAEDIKHNNNMYLDILQMELRNTKGKVVTSPFLNHELPNLHIEVALKEKGSDIGYLLYDAMGKVVYATSTLDSDEIGLNKKTGKVSINTPLPKRLLNEGNYTIRPFAFVRGQECFLHPARNKALPSLTFQISGGLSDSDHFRLKREGMLALILPWELTTSK